MLFKKKEKTVPEKKSAGRIIKEWAGSIILAILLATLIRSSVVMAYVIPSGSMLTTLEIGDRILVNKAAYNLRLPLTKIIITPTGHIERGDIVVFDPPFPSKEPYIKRVIGVGGDTIEIVNKKVILNGKPQNEPYIRFEDKDINPAGENHRDNMKTIRVPEGKLFMMGDNRDSSYDSRFWGFADETAVLGKAKYHLWSWDSAHHKPRLSRFFSKLH